MAWLELAVVRIIKKEKQQTKTLSQHSCSLSKAAVNGKHLCQTHSFTWNRITVFID